MNKPTIKSSDVLLLDGQLKPELLKSVITVLHAEAFLEVITPIYNDICTRALAKFKPVIEDTGLNRRARSGEIGEQIIAVDQLYLASDADSKNVYSNIKIHLNIKGFTTTNPDHCPFLVAQSRLREANAYLIDAMEPYTKVSNKMLYNLESRAKYIQLTMRCLVTKAEATGVELNQYKKFKKAQ